MVIFQVFFVKVYHRQTRHANPGVCKMSKFFITQLNRGYFISNKYMKVMSKIPNYWDNHQPLFDADAISIIMVALW